LVRQLVVNHGLGEFVGGCGVDGDDMVVLVCPAGAADGKISHNDQEFVPWRENIHDPHSKWLVEVPKEVAHFFCFNAGFCLYAKDGSSG
jgi:hypothetical protein